MSSLGTFLNSGGSLSPNVNQNTQDIENLRKSAIPNILHNTWLNSPSVVNQKGFDGDWSGLSVDEQGWDLWRKYDSTRMFQVIEEGSYLPNSVYTLQADGEVIWQGNSPSSGNWGIAVPIVSDQLDLRIGDLQLPWNPEEQPLCRQYCFEQYYSRRLSQGGAGYQTSESNYTIYYNLSFPVRMLTPPEISSTIITNGNSGTVLTNIDMVDTDSCRIVMDNSGSFNRIYLSLNLEFDATLKLADVNTWTII